jgi:hypothetical protein
LTDADHAETLLVPPAEVPLIAEVDWANTVRADLRRVASSIGAERQHRSPGTGCCA